MLTKCDPAASCLQCGATAVIDVIEFDFNIGVIFNGSYKAKVGSTKTAGITGVIEGISFDLAKGVGLPIFRRAVIDDEANINSILDRNFEEL